MEGTWKCKATLFYCQLSELRLSHCGHLSDPQGKDRLPSGDQRLLWPLGSLAFTDSEHGSPRIRLSGIDIGVNCLGLSPAAFQTSSPLHLTPLPPDVACSTRTEAYGPAPSQFQLGSDSLTASFTSAHRST